MTGVKQGYFKITNETKCEKNKAEGTRTNRVKRQDGQVKPSSSEREAEMQVGGVLSNIDQR